MILKLDRRTFVKGMALAGGAVLGTALSPAPWYLIRDLAFWTQNWPWVPVPQPGEPSFKKTTCRLCEGGCGINVRMVDSRLVRIDGDMAHPVNRGATCPMGTAALQMLYSPVRIKSPMRKVGDRDNPSWEFTPWPKAIEEVIRKIRELRAAGNSHLLACITNESDSTLNDFFQRFLQAVGSRNFMKMTSGTDAQRIAVGLLQGPGAKPAYDIENAGYILSFGCGLFDGWGSPGRMYRAHSMWFEDPHDTRIDIVQIEPNLSVTAAKASRWVPIKPGTEAALALGIAHVLIRDELYDKSFVRKHCLGFEDWEHPDGKRHRGFKSEVLARYSPRIVEFITRVPVREIEALAREFATKRPSIALGGKGNGEEFVNLYELMAVHSLNALVGNIGRPGGILEQPDVPLKPLPPVNMDKEALRGYAVARHDEAGSDKYPFTGTLPTNLNADNVSILFTHEANPYYVFSDRNVVREIFEKVPYIVSFSSFMDETTIRADLILPVPTPFERWDDQLGIPGLQFPVYNLNRPLIPPVYQTQNAADSLIAIARGLGGTVSESFPWNNLAEAIRQRAEGLYESRRGRINASGALGPEDKSRSVNTNVLEEYASFPVFWSRLVENGCWFDPEDRHERLQEILKSPSGKFEFFSSQLRSAFRFTEDFECMPHYSEPPPNPKGFDLLVMPKNIITMADRGMGTPPLLIKQLDEKTLKGSEIFVQMNPITAMYQNLEDGDSVILETSTARVSVKISTFAEVREGVVLIPLGFGHTALDRFQRNKGVNARQMFDDKKDVVSGLPIVWATPGKITKA